MDAGKVPPQGPFAVTTFHETLLRGAASTKIGKQANQQHRTLPRSNTWLAQLPKVTGVEAQMGAATRVSLGRSQQLAAKKHPTT